MDQDMIDGIKEYLRERYGDNVPSFPRILQEDLPDFEKATRLNSHNLISALAPLESAGYITIHRGDNQLQEIVINRSFPF
ncbi:hypothetical protein DMC16_05005 [Lacticaseibacillus paracasei]|uniref:hypothetical protein n=1 Tax=Lacticaseibacillus paracasei TaxID=1597 RepID=UPI000D751C0D|nr:hypothetical protein [Lacticaseibacillus paracasei]AWR90534.1 hypothetical protein DMC16_05005 [Lacticaseibacillus paracasei]